MKTFQVVFMDGRLQTLMAERWYMKHDAVCFEQLDNSTVDFPSSDLLMIDELPGEPIYPAEFYEALPAGVV